MSNVYDPATIDQLNNSYSINIPILHAPLLAHARAKAGGFLGVNQDAGEIGNAFKKEFLVGVN